MIRFKVMGLGLSLLVPIFLSTSGFAEATGPAAAALATAKATADAKPGSETAIFAGGCFWCMQPPFDKLKSKGVLKTVVGYTGGHKANPTYEETSSGTTGHREAIEVTFDPKKISYKELLSVFWKNIDPYDPAGEFCDKGEQYTSAVFYSSDEQKAAYEASLVEIVAKEGIKKDKVTTALLPAKPFYPAEGYHQSYYKKNALKYKFYRYRCGRDQRLKEIWGTSGH